MRRAVALSLLVLTLGAARPAFAQDNSATVEALFNEGRRLASEGKLAEACPKFLASYNLERRVGTLMNLADCYEKNGQLASAWARFVEVRTAADRAGQPERADYARQHAEALLPRLPKLTITVAHPPPGLQVMRDGVAVDAAILGVAVPVDPGDHVVEASAPGKVHWSSTAHVGGESASALVDIPPLTDVPVVAPVGPVPAVPAPLPASVPPGADASRGLSGRAIGGIALAGAGVVAIGVGAAFGVMAIGKKNDSAPGCDVGGVANQCYPDGASTRHDAVVDANVASVLVGVGAAMAVGGAVLWLWPASSRGAPAVSLDLRGVRLGGAF
jgi:serine/threonine-protein kinase